LSLRAVSGSAFVVALGPKDFDPVDALGYFLDDE
jgi:hypothetical protein